MEDSGFVSTIFLDMKIADWVIMDAYEKLRSAYEVTYPKDLVDASDAFILTVLPYDDRLEDPYDGDTVNYATGFYNGVPALMRCDDDRKVFVIGEGGKLAALT